MTDEGDIIKDIVAKVGDEAKKPSFLSGLEKRSDDTLKTEENDGILVRRKQWSFWVLLFIGAIIFFDMMLVVLYGMNLLTFKDPNVVIAVITDNFLKIFGLGYLITRETFKKIY